MSAHMKTLHTSSSYAVKSSQKAIKTEEDEFITAEEFYSPLHEKYTKVGCHLAGARFREGLTQKQLAEMIGIRPHHISEMEHGKRTIGKEMAKKLAAALNANYKDFL